MIPVQLGWITSDQNRKSLAGHRRFRPKIGQQALGERRGEGGADPAGNIYFRSMEIDNHNGRDAVVLIR